MSLGNVESRERRLETVGSFVGGAAGFTLGVAAWAIPSYGVVRGVDDLGDKIAPPVTAQDRDDLALNAKLGQQALASLPESCRSYVVQYTGSQVYATTSESDAADEIISKTTACGTTLYDVRQTVHQVKQWDVQRQEIDMRMKEQRADNHSAKEVLGLIAVIPELLSFGYVAARSSSAGYWRGYYYFRNRYNRKRALDSTVSS